MSSGQLRIHLTPAAVTAVRRGHPWVYADRLREQNRPGETGEIAALYDGRDRFLGLGLFDPGSPLRVRMLHVGPPVRLNSDWWISRLNRALEVREGLFDDQTTGWRAIHGESDGWPGLILDRYGSTAVLKLYTTAWLVHLQHLVPLIVRVLEPQSIVLRLSRNIQEEAKRSFQRGDGDVLHGDSIRAPVEFLESGIRFEAEVIRGQKTGFFLDQRENRRWVSTVSAGAEVLNAFSFSGGFSLHAARGGARLVTDVDLSAHALDSARRNFARNQDHARIASARHEGIQADVFDWLAQSRDRTFDLVILDPPSLARRQADRPGALAAYRRLSTLGTARVRQGGILFAASCSAHVPEQEFFEQVITAVRGSGRAFSILRKSGHPPDHPAGFPEARYLKAICLRLDSRGPS